MRFGVDVDFRLVCVDVQCRVNKPGEFGSDLVSFFCFCFWIEIWSRNEREMLLMASELNSDRLLVNYDLAPPCCKQVAPGSSKSLR